MEAFAGISVSPLRIIGDERGRVMKVLSSADPQFAGFGEAYLSTVAPGTVKGWKTHLKTVQNMAVPIGRITFLLKDRRPESPTFGRSVRVTLAGEPGLYRLLTVPPGVSYAWRNDSPAESYVTNCQSAPHDPAEGVTAPLEEDPPDWEGAQEM